MPRAHASIAEYDRSMIALRPRSGRRHKPSLVAPRCGRRATAIVPNTVLVAPAGRADNRRTRLELREGATLRAIANVLRGLQAAAIGSVAPERRAADLARDAARK